MQGEKSVFWVGKEAVGAVKAVKAVKAGEDAALHSYGLELLS